ncbi:hypothetical protein [Mucilaginibacter pocheonensis]|uniref:Uncharacterized protein n=1 Tax=Mucilaginibacter pocheonensis TaxID=398050 RepID=A0ABU1TDS7_9SPHI|nr:hypothetical protein [Mucilaginibacter pocheonensis]MDR6943006.1 hypothetical protein [Mucilaginibacter pocheonensis]
MQTLRRCIVLSLFFYSFILVGKSQTKEINDFTKFVGKAYKVPDSLKQNCEWIYAFVKLKTDARNKVVKIGFINKVPQAIKAGFGFLIGYQFSKAMKTNGHPIVFYFSIDNSEICKPKPGDFIYYYPNQVVEIITSTLLQIKKEDPKTIFIPELIVKKFYETQH